MFFEIKNKVALVTGGAAGLGFNYAKELLRNGVKGVTIADINSDRGEKALEEIEEIFGPNKAIFVQTDVTNFEEFEAAFLKTLDYFNNVDILINNAGIANDRVWEKEVLINLNGTINGTILGIEKYLPKYMQGDEAVILNISSICGTDSVGSVPVYAATKYAIIGLVRSWGIPEMYESTKVRVIGLCPGLTLETDIFQDGKIYRSTIHENIAEHYVASLPTQKPDIVAKEAMKIIKYASTGTLWVVEGGETAFEYTLPDRTTMKNNVICCQ